MVNNNPWFIPESKLNEAIESIDNEADKLRDYITIFHDKFNIPLHRNSLVLVPASSGTGKSTFFHYSMLYLKNKGQKTILFTNEEGKNQIRNTIYLIEKTRFPDKSKDEIMRDILGYILIVDLDDTKNIKYQDKVVDTMFKYINEYKPDMVILDQLSYVREKSDGSMGDDYRELPKITSNIADIINSDNADYPPILLSQQALTVIGEDSGQCLRGAKNTALPMTHILLLFREHETRTLWVEVNKFRKESDYAKLLDINTSKYYQFKMNHETGYFDFEKSDFCYHKPRTQLDKDF